MFSGNSHSDLADSGDRLVVDLTTLSGIGKCFNQTVKDVSRILECSQNHFNPDLLQDFSSQWNYLDTALPVLSSTYDLSDNVGIVPDDAHVGFPFLPYPETCPSPPEINRTSSIEKHLLPIPNPFYLTELKETRWASALATNSNIPRPPNSFVLFRKCLRDQGLLDPTVKRMADISALAGQLWKGMSDEQKVPWMEFATLVLSEHKSMFPGYVYSPNQRRRNRGQVKKGEGEFTIIIMEY